MSLALPDVLFVEEHLNGIAPTGAVSIKVFFHKSHIRQRQGHSGVPPALERRALPDEIAAPDSFAILQSHRGRRDVCPTLRQIKLYNSGSFFDPRAIPQEDYVAIAERVRAFERVIVECHPALVGGSAGEFRDLLKGIGVNTARRPV